MAKPYILLTEDQASGLLTLLADAERRQGTSRIPFRRRPNESPLETLIGVITSTATDSTPAKATIHRWDDESDSFAATTDKVDIHPWTSAPGATDGERVHIIRSAHNDGIKYVAIPPDPTWGRWRNDNRYDAPPGAIIRVTGTTEVEGEAGKVWKGTKPDDTFRTLYFVNGQETVKGTDSEPLSIKKRIGWCRPITGLPIMTACDSLPESGQIWGAAPEEWKLFQNYPGFNIVGPEIDEEDHYQARAIQREVTRVKGQPLDDIGRNRPSAQMLAAGFSGFSPVIQRNHALSA